jgi:uncharacterized protein with NAD-binding domain and iron-sulfur cluster
MLLMLVFLHAKQNSAMVDSNRIQQAQYELLLAEHNARFHDNMQPATIMNQRGHVIPNSTQAKKH